MKTSLPGSIVLASLLVGGCSRLQLDDPGGVGGAPPGTAPPPLDHPVISLVSAVGGPARAFVGWKPHAGPASLPHFALFVGTSMSDVYALAPVLVDPPGTSAVLEGLADDTTLFVGLGVRSLPGDPWSPNGPILRVRTGAPIYVDPAAPPGGDGTTPATASNDLPLAILDAFFLNGGGNVWIKGGDAGIVSLPVWGGVYVSGGFDDSMLLEARDPELFPTRVQGTVNVPIFEVQAGNGPAVLDGLTLDGRLEASSGVQAFGFSAELRSLVIRDCRRGVDLRSPGTGTTLEVLVTGVTVRNVTVEGMRVDGPYHVWVEGSSFHDCNNEGLALNDLVCPELGSVSLVARASNFAHNGEEGIDCHLAAPAGSGQGGGRFVVTVQDCDFQVNGKTGLNVDIDTEAFPNWATDVEVRGCVSRGNGLAGVRLDLDSTSSTLLHRLTCSANGAEGIHVSSESWPGTATISCCALLGNAGAGIRGSFGQVGVLASHCLLAGNRGGGLSSEVAPAAAASCLGYLQPSPYSNELAVASPVQDDGLPEPFRRSAREYGVVTSISGSELRLSAQPQLPLDGPLEVADDGVARTVLVVNGSNVAIDPSPEGFLLPASAGFFPPGTGTVENFRLAAGSFGEGAGLARPGDPPVDAGPFGSPSGGDPGREDPVPAALFRLASTTPPWTQPIAPAADLLLAFAGGDPDPATAPGAVRVVDANGLDLGAIASVDGVQVRVTPPIGGWSSGQVVELFPALRSTDGRALAVPLALPVRSP